jgi:polyisoprenoid-binding protein YceI
MPIPTGTHTLDQGDGTLIVKTGKGGAASKAGHNLTMEVTRWDATVQAGEDGPRAMALTADGHSFRVVEGTGGAWTLGEEEMDAIVQTIAEEVLTNPAIEFRSTGIENGTGDTLSVEGDLELAGRRHPVSFDVTVTGEGRLTGHAVVTQSDWGIKPYTALFGTLKVSDEVEVLIDAKLT